MAPMCEFFEEAVTSLRPGFPAYCVYVPSGMAEPFTKELVRRIRVWGRNMGANLFVCYWDIGAPEFVDLMKKIGWKKRPFLFLTNKCEIDDTSYIVSIDDQELIRNNEELQKLLPQILDLILVEDNVQEIEKTLKGKQETDLKNLISKISLDKRYKFTVSGFGFSVSTGTATLKNETQSLTTAWKSLVAADGTIDEKDLWNKIIEVYTAHQNDLTEASINKIETMMSTVPVLLTAIEKASLAGQHEKAEEDRQVLMQNYQSLIKTLQ